MTVTKLPHSTDIHAPATAKVIEVYVCPWPKCANFYGTSSMPELEKEFTGPMVEERGKLKQETGSPWRHNRAECPDCRHHGRKVQRVRLSVVLQVPTEGPPTPPNPPGYRYGDDGDPAA